MSQINRVFWNVEKKYIELGKRIVKHFHIPIVVTFSPADKDYAKSVVDGIGDSAYLTPETTIREVASFVQDSLLCICNNSGIMHIAYAVNTAVLCFNTSIGWHPFGKNDISIDRIPKEIKNNRLLTGEQVEKLLDTISVDEAYEEFEKFIDNI